jgi:hypothetical protein
MSLVNIRFAISFSILSLALAACSPGMQGSPTQLEPGRYTALGGVRKSEQPTASDLADMQAAENGTLNEPALVEFYADN